MGQFEKDRSGESKDIKDSVQVTSRILEMHPDAFTGRENLVEQQKLDMQYQKRTDRPTGPVSRLLGKPALVDEHSGDQAKPAVRPEELTKSEAVSSWDEAGSKLVKTNLRKPDGIASFEELFPDRKGIQDDSYKAMLEKLYPKGIPYRVMPSGRRLPWSGIENTITESPTLGRDFEPQNPTTNSAVRG